MSREAVIVSAARTPVGRCRGALASIPVEDLGVIAAKEAVKRADIDPREIDDIVFGNIWNNDIACLGRYIGLKAGFPIQVPGVRIDRQCASSLNAIAYGAAMIEAGHEDIILAGGAESDSRRPYMIVKPTSAYQVNPPMIIPNGTGGPGDMGINMGLTAENIAKKYGFARTDLDAFAVSSHQKAAFAQENGFFDSQIISVDVDKGKGNIEIVSKDECVRPGSSVEALAKLKTSFLADGVVTAGNSSPMSDGAGAIVMMTRERAESINADRIFKVSGFAAAGVDPRIMGTGPIAAVKKLFKRKGLSWVDIDLIEMNEAFASQSLACIRDLDMPIEKVNVNGGALALGHPLGATGAVLVTKMIYELERRNQSTGLVCFCIGGGQGAAAFFERIK
ncbi:MAG: thiolase family protein [Lachnospiraceae bacterium]|nr:thiolase family protein [Lachnospiraceae bacterium]